MVMVHGSLFLLVACTSQTAFSPFRLPLLCLPRFIDEVFEV